MFIRSEAKNAVRPEKIPLDSVESTSSRASILLLCLRRLLLCLDAARAFDGAFLFLSVVAAERDSVAFLLLPLLAAALARLIE